MHFPVLRSGFSFLGGVKGRGGGGGDWWAPLCGHLACNPLVPFTPYQFVLFERDPQMRNAEISIAAACT